MTATNDAVELGTDEIVIEQTLLQGGPPKFYVTQAGIYLGSVSSPPDDWDFYAAPEGGIEVPSGPDYADQLWHFDSKTWGPSRSQAVAVEDAWRLAELPVIARQLEAIEEAEASDDPADQPPDLLPGTRKQWLSYRTKVSNWKDGTANFPEIALRPVRPT